jgi:serine/threonine protein kinase
VFSVGLVIFYALTGQVLYEGNTTYELLVKAATGPGPEELARIHALPAPAAALVARALSIDPSHRFGTAAAFAAAITPSLARGSDTLAHLVDRLFRRDFLADEKRFATAVPSGSSEMRAAPTSTIPPGPPSTAPGVGGGPTRT